MASIHETRAGYEVRWRYEGQQFNQTTGVAKDAPDAHQQLQAIKGRIEDAIRALKSGWLRLPDGADYDAAKRFIFTGGKKAERDAIAPPRVILTLEGLFAGYVASRPSNEASTLYTEGIHRNHVLRIMGGGTDVESIDFNAIQRYADARRAGYTHGGRRFARVGPDTIKKELKTLGKVWNWAVHRGLIAGAKPWEARKLNVGRAAQRERFRDFDEITEIISADGLSDGEAARFWACLYLRGPEVAELLDHVRDHGSVPFVYPMFCLCALTECRRSEAIRALKRDFDFKAGVVSIREKKKDSSKEFTLRDVPMNARLAEVMRGWFADHPCGKFAICDDAGRPITVRSGRLDREFEATLRGSKFAVMRGWHCLRHSFASILASKGIDQRVINKLMGHLDQKTVDRYQHLYKETGQDAVNALLS